MTIPPPDDFIWIRINCHRVVPCLFRPVNVVLFLKKKNQNSRFDEFLNAQSSNTMKFLTVFRVDWAKIHKTRQQFLEHRSNSYKLGQLMQTQMKSSVQV